MLIEPDKEPMSKLRNGNRWILKCGWDAGSAPRSADPRPLLINAQACEKRIVVAEMRGSFVPRLDILPEHKRRLWPELDAVPADFVLYGGTGLALPVGHRVSEDFDFFSSAGFDPEHLCSRLPFFRDLDPANPDAWVYRKRDYLEALLVKTLPPEILPLLVRKPVALKRPYLHYRVRAA